MKLFPVHKSLRILVFRTTSIWLFFHIEISDAKIKKSLRKKNWILSWNEYFCIRFEYLFICMKTRLQRQVAIRKIIDEEQVSSQEQLLMLLKHEGFELTQATLSRDLKQLKVVKAPGMQGEYVYRIPSTQNVRREELPSASYFTDGFLSVDVSGNIAVIRTKPAHASSIAAIIDASDTYEVLGTIAGDDTIFMVMREGVERGDLIPILVKIMPKLRGRLI
jgi:transcriptional regulator of arginine metabolism